MCRFYITSFLLLFSITACSSNQTVLTVTEKDLIAVGNHAGLIRLYKDELIKEPNSTVIMLKLAQSYYDDGDNESASFYVEQLKKEGAREPELYLLSGNIAADAGLFEQAKNDYKTSEAKGYHGSELYIKLGIVFTELKQYIEAEAAFNQARLKGHDDIAVKNNLAVLYLGKGEYLRAVEMLTPVYRQHSDEKKLAFNLAISLFKVGDYREAHRLLSDDFSDEQISALFNSLRPVN